MNILIIDPTANALDWALRCQEAGHIIRWYMDKTKEGLYNKTGDGMVPKIKEWNAGDMRWADLIFVTDNNKHIERLESFHKRGFPIFGCNLAGAEWELDRGVGQKVFEKAGIKTLPTEEFSSYDKAIAFLEEQYKKFPDKRFVSKAAGDSDRALSYVSKNYDDMIYMLERWKKKNALKGAFILQEFTTGIEMAVGGWFGPGGFSKYFLENWEQKKLMSGDIGVATGEMGTVERYTKTSKLADCVLKPVEDQLHSINYIGYVDVNCIIDDKGNPWPLEFTMRPGWPCFQIQQALHKGDPAKWMVDLIDGFDTIKVEEDKIAVGVVMAIPDFPYSHLTKKEVSGVPIYGITDKNKDNVHLAEVQLGEAPVMGKSGSVLEEMPVTAGDYCLIVSGIGKTVVEASEASYKVVKELIIPNSPIYRDDIGERLEEQLDELHKIGFAKDMDYC